MPTQVAYSRLTGPPLHIQGLTDREMSLSRAEIEQMANRDCALLEQGATQPVIIFPSGRKMNNPKEWERYPFTLLERMMFIHGAAQATAKEEFYRRVSCGGNYGQIARQIMDQEEPFDLTGCALMQPVLPIQRGTYY